jgi:hypothetical protein
MTDLDTGHQTVVIRKGRHDSPERGACVMELSSMLAGEAFSDHPATVCPVIAGFLRSYNDLLPDGQHDELYAYAAQVVGTSASASASLRRRRARRIIEWAGAGRQPRLRVRLRPWDLILLPSVEAALRMTPERRRVAVSELIDELVAMSAAPAVTAPATTAAADDPVVDGHRSGARDRPKQRALG